MAASASSSSSSAATAASSSHHRKSFIQRGQSHPTSPRGSSEPSAPLQAVEKPSAEMAAVVGTASASSSSQDRAASKEVTALTPDPGATAEFI